MIAKNYFKLKIKKTSIFSKSRSGNSVKGILNKMTAFPKTVLVVVPFSITLLSGCATIGEKVAYAADALKTDVQTQHDENFRIKRVRKALLIGDIPEAEKHRDNLYALHWRCIANLEIAAAKYPTQKSQALKSVKQVTKEIWTISDPNKRAMALLALLKFELETSKDVTQAKKTAKQTKKTIAFILDDHARKMRRYGELQTLIEKHNHLLSR